MNKYLSHRKLLLLISSCVFIITSCSDEDASYRVTSERFDMMTVQQQMDYAPTALFRAIYRNDAALFERELPNAFVDFHKQNIAGETALVVAIQLRRHTFAEQLVEKATFEYLTYPNVNHRSYLSLLAEFNLEGAFDVLARKYENQLKFMGAIRSNFRDLDLADDRGRTALFYVQTASFADKLRNLYFYGITNIRNPWDHFYNQYDNKDNTFIHVAAEYGKTEIIKWYTDEFCGENWIEEGDRWWIREGIGAGWEWVRNSAQDADWLFFRRRFVNLQNENGNNALHLAARNGQNRAIELLMQCSHTDPTQQNKDQQFPLQYMLANLDPDQQMVSQSFKDSFMLLIEQIHPIWGMIPLNSFNFLANHKDAFGFTAVHYASRLKDRFFYDTMQKYEWPVQDDSGVISGDRDN